MSSKERLKAKLSGQSTERNLFCPAIYEHKAKLINESVSNVAKNGKLLEEAVLAEYETYQPDMLTIGIDIYNIEAEALGAEVVFSDKADVVPSIKEKILKDISDVDKLQMPHISTVGRIPLLLKASEKINLVLGKNVLVRGALSGPYSIAAELMGIEPLIMAMMTDQATFVKLLDFTTSFVIAYGKEYIKKGISICLFDSQASPPLVSPDMFEKFLLPRYKKIAHEFETAGCECSELVIGGQTDTIAPFMMDSEFDIVLSDFSSDTGSYFNQSRTKPIIRRNINPVLIEQGNFDVLQQDVDQVKQLASRFSNVVISTGVLSYNVPTENILKVKQMCLEK